MKNIKRRYIFVLLSLLWIIVCPIILFILATSEALNNFVTDNGLDLLYDIFYIFLMTSPLLMLVILAVKGYKWHKESVIPSELTNDKNN